MRILLTHNRYQQRGGEDAVVQAEKELLSAAGHEVAEYSRHNNEIANYGLWQKATLGPRTVWAWDSYRQLKMILQKEKPDLAHFHNTLPLISPAAYEACREEGIPVVQTVQNYRLLCPAATFLRDGQVCEECFQHNLWRGVRYGCYRGSRPATAVVAAMLAFHRWLDTWSKSVDCYAVPTEFARRKFVAGGLPAEKVVVKPNFLHPDPRARTGSGEYVLFVGRLSPEKGLTTLLRAWACLGKRIPLLIVGAGPMREELEVEAIRQNLGTVRFLGRLSGEQVLSAMKGARFLVFPSVCYEGFPVTLVESFACGLPPIASRLGAMEEIIEDGRTGLHFTPGDPDDLAAKVEWAWTHPERMEEMGRAARAEYEAKYTAERNYQLLMDIYQRAIAVHKAD
jgi:glycosyltransferase involved in cell wall biosynthesis